HYMDTAFEKGFGGRVVRVVGTADDHIVNAVLPGCFLLCHFVVIPVQALPIQAQPLAGLQRPLEIPGEAARHQPGLLIEGGSLAVHLADIGAETSTHHTKTEYINHRSASFSFHHDGTSVRRGFALGISHPGSRSLPWLKELA